MGEQTKGDEYEHSSILVLRYKVLNPSGESDAGTINSSYDSELIICVVEGK